MLPLLSHAPNDGGRHGIMIAKESSESDSYPQEFIE
jgi:hypothetical protein